MPLKIEISSEDVKHVMDNANSMHDWGHMSEQDLACPRCDRIEALLKALLEVEFTRPTYERGRDVGMINRIWTEVAQREGEVTLILKRWEIVTEPLHQRKDT